MKINKYSKKLYDTTDSIYRIRVYTDELSGLYNQLE